MARDRGKIADKEVLRFLDGLARDLAHPQRHAACLERFGAARTPSVDQIKARFLTVNKFGSGAAQSGLYSRPEVRQWIDDRIGTMTLSELAASCRRKFGEGAPSRTALGRYFQRARGDLI